MQAEWIAVDWGTTNLRVWVFDAAGKVVDQAASEQGMGTLTPDRFEAALVDLIDGFLSPGQVTPVICCGMVGARQGWTEAPYASVPCTPPGMAAAIRPATHDARIAVHILPGLMQSDPPDVMRGEETQIGGFLAANPGFDGVICLPGTHTKWTHVSAGEIVSFRTFMTGELFALLSKQSVLRHSLDAEGWDDAAFCDAVGDAMSRPQYISTRLFSLRAAGLIGAVPAAVTRARLSGLLIGLELAGSRPFWLGQDVAIVGDETLGGHYAKALEAQGLSPRHADGGAMTLAGLTAAYATYLEQTS